MNKFITICLLILLIPSVLAWSSNTFNGTGQTSENLTFTGNQNITRWLSIPNTVSALTKGYLNLSGYIGSSLYRNENISVYAWQSGGVGSSYNDGSKANDTNWGTYAYGSCSDAYDCVPTYVPFTIHHNFTNPDTNNLKYAELITNQVAPNLELSNSITCLNLSSNGWISIGYYGYWDALSNKTFTIPNNCIGDNVSIKTMMTSNDNLVAEFYENKIIFYNTTYPINPSLKIGDEQVWTYSGQFNQTNNKTNNFASTINKYLTSAYLVGSNYLIPFIFHSDTVGILEYLDLLFNNYGFTENSQTYNSQAVTSTLEYYYINLTYDPNFYTSISSNLIYGGTSYTASVSSQSGNNIVFYKSLITPAVSDSVNKTFYWSLALTNSSGVNYFNSTSNNQTISPILMQICSPTFNVTYFNFTVKDADYPTQKVNATFKASFSYGTTNLNSNYSYQDLSEKNNSFAFCFSPSSSNYIVNAKIEYGATSYANNYYYLNNASFSNQTQNITIYLLNSSKSTPTILKVQTETQSPLSETYIQIQRYDSGTDTYYTVAMAKTDFNGEDVVYLNWYDTFYRYTISKDYKTILMTNTSKISATPVIFTIIPTITYSYDKFLDIDYSLIFNNETNNFILTYSLPSGEITSACLRVVKRTIVNDTTICNTCETSSSATIYCNIAAYGNGTYVASFYAIGSYGLIESIVRLIGVSMSLYEDIGNIDGSIYAFLFAGVILVMFFITPVLGVVGMILGMLGAMILGFQPLNYMEFLGIAIIGGVVIMLLKR